MKILLYIFGLMLISCQYGGPHQYYLTRNQNAISEVLYLHCGYEVGDRIIVRKNIDQHNTTIDTVIIIKLIK